MAPVLIIGADDLGASPRISHAIFECLDAGLVSSTSALVWMHGTAVAAGLARDRADAIGLHINLTLPYDAGDVPERIRERQLQLTRVFSKEGWREPADHPELSAVVRDVVRDQLDRFREEFGEPTHVDGHHHVHVHRVVLEAVEELAPHTPVRPRLTVPGTPARWSRTLRLARTKRWRTHALEQVHPDLGGVGLEVLDQARNGTLEIVTHPGDPRNRQALDSPRWRAAVARFRIASYRDLRP